MSMTPVSKNPVLTKLHYKTNVSVSSGSALSGNGMSISSSEESTGSPPVVGAVLADITQHTTSPYALTLAVEAVARRRRSDLAPNEGTASLKRTSSTRAPTPGRSDRGDRSTIIRSARNATAKIESSSRAGPTRGSENTSTPSRIDAPLRGDNAISSESRVGTATPSGSSNSMLPPPFASHRVHPSAAPAALSRKASSKADSSGPLQRKLIAVKSINAALQGASLIADKVQAKSRTTSSAFTASTSNSTPRSHARFAERRRSLSFSARAIASASAAPSHGARRASSRYILPNSTFPGPTSTPICLSRAPSTSLRASTAQRSAIPLSSTRMIKKGSGLSSASSIGEGIEEDKTSLGSMIASSQPAKSISAPATTATRVARTRKDNALSLNPVLRSQAQSFMSDSSVSCRSRSQSGSVRSASTATSFRSTPADVSPSTARPARQRQPRDSWETVPAFSRRTSFATGIAPQEESNLSASVRPAVRPSLAPALLQLSIGPTESNAGDISWESIGQHRPSPSFDIDSNYTPSKGENNLTVGDTYGLPSRSAMSYASPDHAMLHAALREIAPTPAKPNGAEDSPNLGVASGAHRAAGRESATLEEMLRATLLTSSRSHAEVGNGAGLNDHDTWLVDGSVGEAMRADLNTATLPSTPLQMSLNQIVRDPSAVAISRDDFDRTCARAQDLEFVVAQQARELKNFRTIEAVQRSRADRLGKEGDTSTMRLDAMAKVIDQLEQELVKARSVGARTTNNLAPSDVPGANDKIIAEAVCAITMSKHAADAFQYLGNVARLQREDVGDQLGAVEVMRRGFELMTSDWA
ncbi:BQ2448_1901 [Microbotryum intermedium]|uniref:BQ2448_1901 protein n=1 Tax=Microbotryum intermedium TaxID=269621 RepID=A0A238FBI1_9BASI|nr:BQ2448_1901 [Microbotryum intermedium]